MKIFIFNMVIGIIGKIGSGKSFCTRYLVKNYNAVVISCDEIAKEIIENNETDYVQTPPFVFFRSKEAQEECRSKIHTKVFEKIQIIINDIHKDSKLNKSSNDILIAVECALPNNKLFDICDKVICIINSYQNKVNILKNTRDYSEETTKLIYDSQEYYDKYYNKADKIIINDGTKNDFENKIKEAIDEIYIIRK